MVRYESFRLKAVEREQYNFGRDAVFVPPALYQKAELLWRSYAANIMFVGYETLIGPLGWPVMLQMLRSLGLYPELFPKDAFNPNDANAKYL